MLSGPRGSAMMLANERESSRPGGEDKGACVAYPSPSGNWIIFVSLAFDGRCRWQSCDGGFICMH